MAGDVKATVGEALTGDLLSALERAALGAGKVPERAREQRLILHKHKCLRPLAELQILHRPLLGQKCVGRTAAGDLSSIHSFMRPDTR